MGSSPRQGDGGIGQGGPLGGGVPGQRRLLRRRLRRLRGWLIANGRDWVARAVRDPDVLAELPSVRAAVDTGAVFEAERVLSIAPEAYRQVTGDRMPVSEGPPSRPDPADLWDFDDEDEMRRRLPRLSALFLEAPD